MRPRLIADIGGTNARFALAGPDGMAGLATLPVAAYPSFDGALDAYLGAHFGTDLGTDLGLDLGTGRQRPLGSVAIAAAGPREGGVITLTNAPWRIDAALLSRRFGGAPVRLLNDLEAVALGLPALGPADVEVLVPGSPSPDPLPMLAANVGTGFGAAVALPVPGDGRGGWSALGTEAGHMSLVPGGPAEAALFAGVQSVEDAFSGPGYARLLGGATEDRGESVRPAGAAPETGARRIYSQVFGRVLGDLALATGAWGGVYLCGGVTADLHRVFDVEAMLEAFRQKGKMTARMPSIPVLRVTADAPAMRYLAMAEID